MPKPSQTEAILSRIKRSISAPNDSEGGIHKSNNPPPEEASSSIGRALASSIIHDLSIQKKKT